MILRMDEILHHLRNPVNTNKQCCLMVSKWCRISSIHSRNGKPFPTSAHRFAARLVGSSRIKTRLAKLVGEALGALRGLLQPQLHLASIRRVETLSPRKLFAEPNETRIKQPNHIPHPPSNNVYIPNTPRGVLATLRPLPSMYRQNVFYTARSWALALAGPTPRWTRVSTRGPGGFQHEGPGGFNTRAHESQEALLPQVPLHAAVLLMVVSLITPDCQLNWTPDGANTCPLPQPCALLTFQRIPWSLWSCSAGDAFQPACMEETRPKRGRLWSCSGLSNCCMYVPT